ncbi:hypothetical protein BCR43DRAFT_492436 [Syncephalastrum racemosum]|uniref:RING-type domain-containing protein n=1 Tax=Syncephalastrum racemosum TaxID=13706 RepID=A0A1X2HDP1_SYNRA|nr:hypothetical protein BCR43DRAFT_492436 [Syncephalastrum racemosum]
MSLSPDPSGNPKRPRKRTVPKRELEALVDNNGKRARRDFPACPVCKERIDPGQWPVHYQYELSRMDVTASVPEKGRKRGAAMLARQQLEGRRTKRSAYEERLERIQKNRQLRADTLQRMDDTSSSSITEATAAQAPLGEGIQLCPICSEALIGDSDAVNIHIDQCLIRQSENEAQQHHQQQQHQQGSWDEYEWAGQTRVRASALMEGGYSGAGFATTRKEEEDEDVDEDVDVEEEDEAYGESQYNEQDLVRQVEDDDDWDVTEEEEGGGGGEQVNVFSGASSDNPPSLVLDSLKARIHQLETASKTIPRCLICLEPYTTPLTSIVCWHVHCERCWLQTLGTKKLCPQCQKITTPADLRRIYL